MDGALASDVSGFSVSSAGDVNGDGFGDLIIGAPLADPNGTSAAGSSFVLFGRSGGFASADQSCRLSTGQAGSDWTVMQATTGPGSPSAAPAT